MTPGSPSAARGFSLRGRGSSRPPRESVLDPQLRGLAIVVILGTIMSVFDTTIVNVAIDTLGRDFHTNLATIQWVSTAYLLALALVIPLTGWTIERFGAKRMYLISLTLFIAGSALCGLAWSAESLIAFRVLQGLGGGMILPIGQTILVRAAGPQRMGRVMSVVGIPMLLGPVLGPAIGGVIVDNFSWRWIFYVNIPIGLLALALSARKLEHDGSGSAGKLDWAGFALLSPALAGIVYGLSEAGSSGGFSDSRVVVGLAVGVVLLVGFVFHALRSRAPLIDLRLFRDRSFSIAGVVGFLLGASIFGAMFLMPLYYQIVRGQNALHAGLLMAPQGLGAMLAMPAAGRITDKVGAYKIVPYGIGLIVLGTIAYTQVSADSSYVLLAFALFVRGIGLGMSMMPAMTAGYLTLKPSDVPKATTTINIIRQVGGSLGTAVLAVILQRSIVSNLSTGGSGAPVSGDVLGGGTSLPAAARSPIADAFGSSFWWAVGLSALCIIPALLLPRIRPQSRGQGGGAAEAKVAAGAAAKPDTALEPV